MKNLTDKVKVQRAKAQCLRALEEIKNNPNKAEVLGFVTGQLAHTFALLDATKEDEMGIVFVAASILDEINPKRREVYLGSPAGATQLALEER